MATNHPNSVVVVNSFNFQMSNISDALAAPNLPIAPAFRALFPHDTHQVSPHDFISQDRLKGIKARIALIDAGIGAVDEDLARTMLAACRELDHFEFAEYEGKYRTMLENMQRRGFTASDPAVANAANHFAYQAVLNAGIRRIEDDERARALAHVASLPLLESLNKYLGYIEARLETITIYDRAIKTLQRTILPGVELTSSTVQEKIPFDDLPDRDPGSPARVQGLVDFLLNVDESIKTANASFRRMRFAALRLSSPTSSNAGSPVTPSRRIDSVTGDLTETSGEDVFFTPPSSPTACAYLQRTSRS